MNENLIFPFFRGSMTILDATNAFRSSIDSIVSLRDLFMIKRSFNPGIGILEPVLNNQSVHNECPGMLSFLTSPLEG